MHAVIPHLAEPPLSNASTPTIPPPDQQPLGQYLTATSPPPRSKKRSSNEAGNDDVEVRITNLQDDLSASYLPSTILTPSDPPSKRIKTSPEFQINTPSVALLLQKPLQKQPYQQSLRLSARQQDILQHLPPSQLLMDTTAYLSELAPLLASPPSVRNKRAWIADATDEAWEPMSKKPRIERGKPI